MVIKKLGPLINMELGNLMFKPNLFQSGRFKLHSGKISNFRIECDSFKKHDWEALAILVANKHVFDMVIGIPRGGMQLAKSLKKFNNHYSDTILIVDDVLTTGNSMEKMKKEVVLNFPNREVIGVVVFSRDLCLDWVRPIFKMW